MINKNKILDNSESMKQEGLSQTDNKVVSFVKDTYKLFAASMMAGAVGAYVGMPLAQSIGSMMLPLFLLEIGLLIGLQFVKNKPSINLIVMFAFVFMTGLTSVPLISNVLHMSGGGQIIGNAFAMTSLIFAIMSFTAIKSTKDFTTFTKPLMITLIVVIVFSLINAFILHNPILTIAISSIVVFLFSIMVIVDTQNIIKGNYETPIDGAIALYLDFLNIFMGLLQLMGIMNSDD
jgi:modulator of FtsH protease